MSIRVNIRTKYQRAKFAADLAGTLATHPDPQVAAVAEAIAYTLTAPIELVNAKIVACARIAPKIIDALPEDAKQQIRD